MIWKTMMLWGKWKERFDTFDKNKEVSFFSSISQDPPFNFAWLPSSFCELQQCRRTRASRYRWRWCHSTEEGKMQSSVMDSYVWSADGMWIENPLAIVHISLLDLYFLWFEFNFLLAFGFWFYQNLLVSRICVGSIWPIVYPIFPPCLWWCHLG